MENLIENKTKKNKKGEEDGEEKKKRPVIKSATDLQRLKLEKLMKNPEKPIIIPEPPKEKDYMQTVPSFVRNVMGSSAGAGSGEFHVYRHLRRKEYARQKCIQAKSMREQLDDEYQSKLEKNRLAAEAKTAKKRAKRLKKKQRAKKPKTKQNDEEKQETSEDDDDEDDEDGEDENSAVVQQGASEEVTEEVAEAIATETEVTVQNKELELEDKKEEQQDNQETTQLQDQEEDKDKVSTKCCESEVKEVVVNCPTEKENNPDAEVPQCADVEMPQL